MGDARQAARAPRRAERVRDTDASPLAVSGRSRVRPAVGLPSRRGAAVTLDRREHEIEHSIARTTADERDPDRTVPLASPPRTTVLSSRGVTSYIDETLVRISRRLIEEGWASGLKVGHHSETQKNDPKLKCRRENEKTTHPHTTHTTAPSTTAIS